MATDAVGLIVKIDVTAFSTCKISGILGTVSQLTQNLNLCTTVRLLSNLFPKFKPTYRDKLNAVCKARSTHMCKTIASINRLMNVRPFYTRRHIKCANTLNCIRFFDNYIINKHTQSSLFRSIYVFSPLTVTVI